MKWHKGKVITGEIYEPELESVPRKDRARIRREKREEEMLFVSYGIKTTRVKHTEIHEMTGLDERYGRFLCVKPSPLRKCWTFVEEGGARDG